MTQIVSLKRRYPLSVSLLVHYFWSSDAIAQVLVFVIVSVFCFLFSVSFPFFFVFFFPSLSFFCLGFSDTVVRVALAVVMMSLLVVLQEN